MEASKAQERQDGYLDFSRLTPGEVFGMVSALILLLSLWLPWFSTSSENQNSRIGPEENPVIGFGDSANAWQVFGTLDVLLVLACTAPFILSWIVARGHDLTWKPGEVTMLVGMTAFVLILCNGIILGKPDPGIAISLDWGYLIALLATVGMIAAGFLRQALYSDARKPPGVI
jgi:hypothetical protein